MRKMGFIIQDIHTEGQETSPTTAIIVAAIILLLIIIELYRRQKRKFND